MYYLTIEGQFRRKKNFKSLREIVFNLFTFRGIQGANIDALRVKDLLTKGVCKSRYGKVYLNSNFHDNHTKEKLQVLEDVIKILKSQLLFSGIYISQLKKNN